MTRRYYGDDRSKVQVAQSCIVSSCFMYQSNQIYIWTTKGYQSHGGNIVLVGGTACRQEPNALHDLAWTHATSDT